MINLHEVSVQRRRRDADRRMLQDMPEAILAFLQGDSCRVSLGNIAHDRQQITAILQIKRIQAFFGIENRPSSLKCFQSKT